MINDLIDRSDPNFASREFNHDVTALIQSDGLAKLGGQAYPPRF